MKKSAHGVGRNSNPGFLAPIAAVAALALIAAACGGSKSASSSAPGVAADSITIGSHQPLTGPAAPGYSEIAPAAKAMFEYVNNKGGVNGRKINYLYEDDGYNPTNTVSVIRKLVLQNNVFAVFNGLGTPTHEQVRPFLNTEKVPDVMVASGCTCWNDPSKYPYTYGWQTNYTIEGRVLGQYVHQNLAGQKVGYLLQNDDVGTTGAAGLDKEIPAGDVVSRQTYASSALTGGLGNQMSALKSAGANVVVLFTIPAATALAKLGAAQLGYHPQFVVSNIGSEVATLTRLLGSFSKGAASAALLDGMITDSYGPSYTDLSNPWTALFKKIHDQYDAGTPFDGNTAYGMTVAYNFVQALQKAGKNLTRQSLINALNTGTFTGPGVVPLTYSSSDHRGYQGLQMAKIQNSQVTLFGPAYKGTETGSLSTYTGAATTPPANF
jgi:ABC-type branched-subunit amino acid transport system substrate-binding protein